MTRKEHLKFCKICTNQAFDSKEGIICKLTGRIADFQDSCTNFEEDQVLKSEIDAKEKEKVVQNNKASLFKRFFNYVLDVILFLTLIFFISFVSFLLLDLFASPETISKFDIMLEEMSSLEDTLLTILFGWTYFTLSEGIFGKSPAKFITGTKVVDLNGNKPSIKQIMLRSICRYIPFEPLSFFGSDNLGWHDTMSNTRVVNSKIIS